MGMAYRLMYLVGFTPWDGPLPPELKEVIDGAEALPPGRALDVGSGKGSKAVYMAGHGWQVTGVEMVPRALHEAQRRAAAAGVQVDFRLGDVTRLEQLGLTPGYSLVFDFGCYHGLKPAQRLAYAQGINTITGTGARLLLMGFTRALPPVPAGVTLAELKDGLGPAWELEWSRLHQGEGTSAMRSGRATWFCLLRTS